MTKRAPGLIVLDRKLKSVQIGDRLRDAEPKPVSLAALAAEEAAKDPLPVLRRDAAPGVAHGDPRQPLDHRRLDAHAAAFRA